MTCDEDKREKIANQVNYWNGRDRTKTTINTSNNSMTLVFDLLICYRTPTQSYELIDANQLKK